MLLPIHAQTSDTSAASETSDSTSSLRLVDTVMGTSGVGGGLVTVAGKLVDENGKGVPNQTLDITVTDNKGGNEVITVMTDVNGEYKGQTTNKFSGIITSNVSGAGGVSDQVSTADCPADPVAALSIGFSTVDSCGLPNSVDSHTFPIANSSGSDISIDHVNTNADMIVTALPITVPANGSIDFVLEQQNAGLCETTTKAPTLSIATASCA